MAENEIYWVTQALPRGIKVRHVGIVHLDELYRWLKRWLEFKGYFKVFTDFEIFYNEKNNPDGSKNIEIRWHGKNSETKYFAYHIEIIFLLIRVQDIMVGPEDQQVKMQKGDYEFRIGGYLEKGMQGSNFLKKIYENLMNPKRLDEQKFNVYDDVYTLHEQLSAYLNQPMQ